MNKTELMLMVATGGSPVMNHAQVAALRNITPRTLLNQLYRKDCPIPMWKDGGEWFAHVSDIATWIDEQRARATS